MDLVVPATGVPDDPNLEEEKTITGFTAHRVNGAKSSCGWLRRQQPVPSSPVSCLARMSRRVQGLGLRNVTSCEKT